MTKITGERPFVIEQHIPDTDHFEARILWLADIEAEPQDHVTFSAAYDVANDELAINVDDLGCNTADDFKARWGVWIDIAKDQIAKRAAALDALQ